MLWQWREMVVSHISTARGRLREHVNYWTSPVQPTSAEEMTFPDGWPTGIISWRQFPTASLMTPPKWIPDGFYSKKPSGNQITKVKKYNLSMHNFSAPSDLIVVPYTCPLKLLIHKNYKPSIRSNCCSICMSTKMRTVLHIHYWRELNMKITINSNSLCT